MSETTVTSEVPPSRRITLTLETSLIVSSSSVTAETQCPQVMPVTSRTVVRSTGEGSLLMSALLVVVAARGCRWPGGSGPHEPCDRVAGLADLLRALLLRGAGGVDHAVAQVVLDQPEPDGLECAGDGGDLGEHVDAVDVLVDHPGNAADLALDAAHPAGVVLLGAAVSGHGNSFRPSRVYTPRGYRAMGCASRQQRGPVLDDDRDHHRAQPQEDDGGVPAGSDERQGAGVGRRGGGQVVLAQVVVQSGGGHACGGQRHEEAPGAQCPDH